MRRPVDTIESNELQGMRVEYVRSRQILRLSGPEVAAADSLEIPLSGLIRRLGLETPASPRVRYLLFGGLHTQERTGGTSNIVGVFNCESRARQAFVELRHQRTDCEGWAELAAVNGNGRVTVISWFGIEPRTKSAGPRLRADASAGWPEASRENRKPRSWWKSLRLGRP